MLRLFIFPKKYLFSFKNNGFQLNSQSWTYLDDLGGRHQVNLYHSPRDGKLLVQVDKQTVIATVHARQPGRWTFLIEEELCDVVISRRGLEYFYGFEVNRRADTPRNRAYKKQERRDFWLPLGIFLGALAVCSVLIFGRKQIFKSRQKPAGEMVSNGPDAQLSRLGQVGKTATATLKKGNPCSFAFTLDNAMTYRGTFFLKKNAAGQPVLPNGLPLEDGDEFSVNFLPENPNVHQLNLMQPTENQLVKYENRAAEVQLILHPNDGPQSAICLAQVARKITGLRGLNDIFYQNYSPEQNPEHNRETYVRLVRDEVFKKMLAENCLR